MKKMFILAVMILFETTLFASYVGSSLTKIEKVTSYNQYGGGDVIFSLNNSIPECPGGYWLSKSDIGFQANVTLIVAALQAKSTVKVYGLPAEKWNGSSTIFCKLYNITVY